MTLISRQAYAEHSKLSKQRVDQLVELGMPTVGHKIDLDAADAWRLSNSDLRKRKLQADIKLQDLKVSEREGSLVKKDEAERFVFETIRNLRDNLLGWVARTAPTLAHELNADPQQCFASLDRLVREFFAEQANEKLNGFQPAISNDPDKDKIETGREAVE